MRQSTAGVTGGIDWRGHRLMQVMQVMQVMHVVNRLIAMFRVSQRAVLWMSPSGAGC